jgi:hypothetical protein
MLEYYLLQTQTDFDFLVQGHCWIPDLVLRQECTMCRFYFRNLKVNTAPITRIRFPAR